MHKLVRVYGMNNVFQYMLDHIPEGSNYTIQNKKAFSRMTGSQYIMTASDYHVMEERYNKIIAQNAAFGNPSGEKFALRPQTDTPEFQQIASAYIKAFQGHRRNCRCC